MQCFRLQKLNRKINRAMKLRTAVYIRRCSLVLYASFAARSSADAAADAAAAKEVVQNSQKSSRYEYLS